MRILYLYCLTPNCDFHKSVTLTTRKWWFDMFNLRIEGTKHYDQTKDADHEYGHVTEIIRVRL